MKKSVRVARPVLFIKLEGEKAPCVELLNKKRPVDCTKKSNYVKLLNINYQIYSLTIAISKHNVLLSIHLYLNFFLK